MWSCDQTVARTPPTEPVIQMPFGQHGGDLLAECLAQGRVGNLVDESVMCATRCPTSFSPAQLSSVEMPSRTPESCPCERLTPSHASCDGYPVSPKWPLGASRTGTRTRCHYQELVS